MITTQSPAAKTVAGVAVSFETLEEKTRQALKAFALKLCHEDNLAEDLVQEAFIIAHRKFAKFDPKRGSFKSWCNSILLNKYRDYLRSAKRREIPVTDLASAGEIDEIADPAAMRDLTVDVEETAVANVSLDQMLGCLSAKERGIAKKLSDGVSEDEIMLAYHISPSKFEQYILSMRSKLGQFVTQSNSYSMLA